MKEDPNKIYNGWDITKGDYVISDDSTQTYQNAIIKKKKYKKFFSVILYFTLLIVITILILAPL
ncbi:MAG: hypothetical protein Fur0015_03310 [Ignavibacteriales bacterium]